MEIQKRKKVRIRVVSLVLLVFVFHDTICQNILEGRYVLRSTQSSSQYVFDSSGQFQYKSDQNLDQSFVGEGEYSVVENKLILVFKEMIQYDSSAWILNSSEKNEIGKSTFNVSVKYASDSVPFQIYPALSIKNKDGKVILQMLLDEEGRVSFQFPTNVHDFKFIEINWVGFHSVRIPIEDLRGLDNVISVYMKRQTEIPISSARREFDFQIQGKELILKNESGYLEKYHRVNGN